MLNAYLRLHNTKGDLKIPFTTFNQDFYYLYFLFLTGCFFINWNPFIKEGQLNNFKALLFFILKRTLVPYLKGGYTVGEG